MNKIFTDIRASAKEINQYTYVIGKYVLSSILKRKIYKKIDILTEGSGILLAQNLYKKLDYHPILTSYSRFGTVRFKNNGNQIEFIGDTVDIVYYTIAISLNSNNYGLLIDTLTLNHSYYETLSIIRSIRNSSELKFTEQISFYSIFDKKKMIKILYIEKIFNELNKILLSHKPSEGISLLYEIGLLSILLPEVTYLKEFEEKEGSNHKDNYRHTLEVVENVSYESNSLWLRWAALLHDIGKFITKKYIHGTGWTFYTHECIGARMIPYLFHRLKFPMDCTMKYVQKIIQYSSRPISLVSYEATNSAMRRLLFYVGESIEDLILLCTSDITTKNFERKFRYMNHFLLVEKKLKNLYLKDNFQKFNTPISGNEIMQFFQLEPSPQVGIIKKAIKEAILNGKLANDFTYIYSFMLKKGKKLGFSVEFKGLTLY